MVSRSRSHTAGVGVGVRYTDIQSKSYLGAVGGCGGGGSGSDISSILIGER